MTNPEAQHARQSASAAESRPENETAAETVQNTASEPAEPTEPAGQPADPGPTESTESGTAAARSAESADEAAEPAQDEGTRRLDHAVRAAEQALIEFEIAVETFRVEVENFSRLHHQRLGPMYSRLDELDALIAEAVAARTGDPEDQRRAREARGLVLPMPSVEELFHGWMDSEGLSPEATAMLTEQPVRPPARVRPSEEARRLYRELARKAHPDLAEDEAERRRRGEFIVRVNAAYAAGDEGVLQALAEEWAAGPRPAERRPSRSEELYARLEWLAERKERLAAMAAELESSAIGAMLKMAPEDPDGLLEEIAEQLLAQVAEKEARLAELVG
ncbi:hypothetical protein LRS74_16720 [Streptomyces sp. LX-29]|uniref:hypothetical protein n=1 Tax=Streptomyces sp. LX-29 TaxID=2900152 RepID=UPI00240E298F|nr:hypothetical protein [Streptomyces sp. LX-29]WFB08504.1 hypothetical protein LRS74_16720 [Streptomyces sp. LX-29]